MIAMAAVERSRTDGVRWKDTIPPLADGEIHLLPPLRNDRSWLMKMRNLHAPSTYRPISWQRHLAGRSRMSKRWVTEPRSPPTRYAPLSLICLSCPTFVPLTPTDVCTILVISMLTNVTIQDPNLSARRRVISTELREKLLREKLLAMRHSSSDKIGAASTDQT